MKVSYNWLQSYFKESLPPAKELAESLNFRAFEVEGLEEVGEDVAIDLDVLPDRACYALSHRGIAREVSAILEMDQPISKSETVSVEKTKDLSIDISDENSCFRYIGRVVEGVEVGESEDWIKARLKTIGQKPINNIVDTLNFVMFDIGEPMHAFDADKVKGDITVRLAKDGEKMTTLDNKELELKGGMLVIADEEGPIALAGVKGGKRAEVNDKTKNVILEAATFNSTSIRKTSSFFNLRTDASKRYENRITPEVAQEAMEEATKMILESSSGAKAGPLVDKYPYPAEKRWIKIKSGFVASVLGIDIKEDEIEGILRRLGILVKRDGEEMDLSIPFSRLDLAIPEDIAEEVGRVYGYERIEGSFPFKAGQRPRVNKVFYHSEVVKDFFASKGFSEVYTHTLSSGGELEVEKSAASNKNYLRSSLVPSLEKSLVLNARHADLLGLDEVRVFEIGKIFKGGQEILSLSAGILSAVKKKKSKQEDELRSILEDFEKFLGAKVEWGVRTGESGSVFEIDLGSFIENLDGPESYEKINYSRADRDVVFNEFSSYPFVLRDIAVFVPEGRSGDDVLRIIKEESGELLVKYRLFDVFEKTLEDGSKKVSYAFRLVFQSMEKTLSDDEINQIMDKVTRRLNSEEGWQVR